MPVNETLYTDTTGMCYVGYSPYYSVQRRRLAIRTSVGIYGYSDTLHKLRWIYKHKQYHPDLQKIVGDDISYLHNKFS